MTIHCLPLMACWYIHVMFVSEAMKARAFGCYHLQAHVLALSLSVVQFPSDSIARPFQRLGYHSFIFLRKLTGPITKSGLSTLAQIPLYSVSAILTQPHELS